MASIIPGFEYDIFISYRHKDNKHDGWVTQFVNNLKDELESTFKEEISVYFDINPHDGLLETDDVHASLQDKLKCLIFIPIISRTYCDPKSFAWENEFKAFVEKTTSDEFGLKVKLLNGNLASRVLIVRIHDLDIADIKMTEAVLEGPMRGIEFIYKELGVNRSLLPGDNADRNLNKTNYRNQINKVSLAIKEIFLGLKILNTATPVKNPEWIKPSRHNKPEPVIEDQRISKLSKKRIVSLVIIASILAMIVIFIPKIFTQDKFKDLKDNKGKISIAVLPFDNLTGDTTLNWFGKGISTLLINGLGNSSALSVVDEYTMSDVFESMGRPARRGISGLIAKEVARSTEAETHITGSFQGTDNNYFILANLVNTKTGKIIWSKKILGDLKSAGYLDVAGKLCTELINFLEIKALAESSDYEFREFYPASAEAYRYYIEGMNDLMNRHYSEAILAFNKSFDIDSTFTYTSFFLAWTCSTTLEDPEARRWTQAAYRHKDKLPAMYQYWLEQWYAFYISKKLDDILINTNKLENSGIRSRWLWFDIGSTYKFIRQYDKSISAFEKVSELNQKRGGFWRNMNYYISYSEVLHKTGRHKQEEDIYNTYKRLFPDNPLIFDNMITCFLAAGDTVKANEYIKKLKSSFDSGLINEREFEMKLGTIYRNAYLFTKAQLHFMRAYEIDLSDTDSSKKDYLDSGYKLAQLLIDNKMNLFGMGIVNDNLKTDPSDSRFLGLKGWILYKQGKYNEALSNLELSIKKSVCLDYDVLEHLTAVEKAIGTLK